MGAKPSLQVGMSRISAQSHVAGDFEICCSPEWTLQRFAQCTPLDRCISDPSSQLMQELKQLLAIACHKDSRLLVLGVSNSITLIEERAQELNITASQIHTFFSASQCIKQC